VENRSEPLTPRERKEFRLSLVWTEAYLTLFASYFLVLIAGDLGWVDYAALLGVDQFTVWVTLSELVAIPVLWACMGGYGLSCMYGLQVVAKRPICWLWIIGPPALLFAWVAYVVISMKVGRSPL
jgi:hypothetical protein